MNAYADTSFLISLYGRDVHSPKADAVIERHHPIFFLTPFGEAEFANACEFRVFLTLWTAAQARAVHPPGAPAIDYEALISVEKDAKKRRRS